jgi:tripartite-type tricarboxylate transporter receptor subunit TctC
LASDRCAILASREPSNPFEVDMSRRLALFRACVIIVASLAAGAARADWPDRPIKWIVPFAPGGANDLMARAAAEGLAARLQQPVVIDNKPGAGAIVGTQYVAKSAPDGYTFLVGAVGVVTNSLLQKQLPYSDSDLVPVAMIAVAPSVIVVNPSVPASNLKEFVAWAKSQGASGVDWSTAGSGSTPHFVAEMLKEAGVDNLVVVPYKSGSEGVGAVLSGNVSATSEASIVVIPQLKAGKLKAIATTYEKRITAYPSIPTAIEQGYPMVNIGHWAGLFAPAGTPPAIVKKMNAELLAVVKSKAFADRMQPSGIEPAPYALADYVKFIAAERERLGRLAKRAGMTAD